MTENVHRGPFGSPLRLLTGFKAKRALVRDVTHIYLVPSTMVVVEENEVYRIT